MKKTLRKRFILFAMSAVTVLLVVLIGAINGFSWFLLESQSENILHTLVEGGEKMPQEKPRGPKPFGPPMDLDTIKAARFFTVRLDTKGTVLDVNIDQISSVSAEEAAEYAAQVTGSSGKINGFRYEGKEVENGRLLFFMDMDSQIRTFLMILSVSSAIAVLVWLLVLLFVVLFSRRIVRPILAGMEKQKQFITNAGHELKTPLAIIQSNNDAATLIYGETKYSRNIRLQTRRLNVLMTNLLTLSKLDEEIKLPVEPVDISELTEEMLPVFQDAALEKNIAFSASICPHVFREVHRETFRQMVSILLDNAVKYTPEGGEIRFSVKKEGGSLLLLEENTCEPPLDPDPERLFERFYRGDSARTQNDASSGYGIGLSAARAIAENFGGKLTAEYGKEGTIRFTAKI